MTFLVHVNAVGLIGSDLASRIQEVSAMRIRDLAILFGQRLILPDGIRAELFSGPCARQLRM